MDGTTQGMIASSIGIVLFLMGYFKGSKSGVTNAVNYMFSSGILAIDEKGNIIAGPKLRNK